MRITSCLTVGLFLLPTSASRAGPAASRVPGVEPEGFPSTRLTTAALTTMPALPPGPAHLEGTLAASRARPMKPTDDTRLAALLKHYEEPAINVAWTMDRWYGAANYDVYDLRFPSPVVTDVPENNTVYCEYYRCRGDQKRPAVIVLHISDGKFVESRAICHYLATQGFDGVMLKMAYYGPRRPKDPDRMRALTQSLDTLCEGTRQSAMDARRAARWLAVQSQIDPARISILGTSLGGFVASVASGVDGRFAHSVFILAGGDLIQVLTTPTPEVRTVREAIEASGLTLAQVARKLELIEPCTFASRIDPASVLMVNTRDDPVVPPASAEALAKAIGGARIEWYDGDHYALIKRFFEVLARVADHLNGRVRGRGSDGATRPAAGGWRWRRPDGAVMPFAGIDSKQGNRVCKSAT